MLPPPPRLSRGTARILRAVIAALRPRGHGFDQPIDEDVLAEVSRFFPYLPGPLRIAFPMGLRLLEWGPPLFARRLRRLSTMPPAEALAYLERVQHMAALSPLILGLRALIFLSFYQHPDVLAVLQVDWAGRAVELTHRRALLLAGAEPAPQAAPEPSPQPGPRMLP